ncbi:unnamed protein product [Orchesella dallaii]|uniref:Uncharacterized protein n=1 Tax=Orchesella dallaii TaxID=48710 RepID=A0ABP1PZW0_9HEXA
MSSGIIKMRRKILLVRTKDPKLLKDIVAIKKIQMDVQMPVLNTKVMDCMKCWDIKKRTNKKMRWNILKTAEVRYCKLAEIKLGSLRKDNLKKPGPLKTDLKEILKAVNEEESDGEPNWDDDVTIGDKDENTGMTISPEKEKEVFKKPNRGIPTLSAQDTYIGVIPFDAVPEIADAVPQAKTVWYRKGLKSVPKDGNAEGTESDVGFFKLLPWVNIARYTMCSNEDCKKYVNLRGQEIMSNTSVNVEFGDPLVARYSVEEVLDSLNNITTSSLHCKVCNKRQNQKFKIIGPSTFVFYPILINLAGSLKESKLQLTQDIQGVRYKVIAYTVIKGDLKQVGDDKVPKRTEEDPPGYYSVSDNSNWGGHPRECQHIRNEPNTYSMAGLQHNGNCNNIPPGLVILQHGYSQQSFPRFHGSKRLREVVFHFTCDNSSSRFWKGFSKPNEVKFLETVARTFYDQQGVTKKNMLETFNRDVQLNNQENAYVFALPMLRLNLTDTIRSAAQIKKPRDLFQTIGNIGNGAKTRVNGGTYFHHYCPQDNCKLEHSKKQDVLNCMKCSGDEEVDRGLMKWMEGALKWMSGQLGL